LSLDCYNSKTADGKAVCNLVTKMFPEFIYNCFWNTQDDHGIDRQLADGIRSFDFRGCQVGNKAVFCHGAKTQRGLGDDFAPSFQHMRDFLKANPGEVIHMALQVEDGDFNVIRGQFLSNIQTYLGDYLYTSTPGSQWPTLGDMVKTGKRVVVFGNWADPSPPKWLRTDYDSLFYHTWAYTNVYHQAKDIKAAITNYCTNPPAANRNKWQSVDLPFSADWGVIQDELKHLRKVEYCLAEFAEETKGMIFDLAKLCYPHFKFFHRVAVDSYWKTPVMTVVRWMNDRNLERVHAGKW